MSITAFLRTMWQYLRPYRGAGWLILAGLLMEMAVNALVPLSFKVLVDDILPSSDRRLLGVLIGVLVVGVVLMAAGGLARDWLYARVSNRIMADIRARLFAHLQRLSLDFYARTDAGQIAARFSTDLAAVEQAVASATWGILPSFDVALTVVLLFVLDWRLALVAMLIFPLSLVGPRFIAPRATRAAYEKKEAEGDALDAVQENAGAQPVVKAYGLESNTIDAYAQRNATLLGRATRVSFLSALIERSAGLGILVLQVLVMAIGGMFALDGKLSPGSLLAFQALFITLSYALYNVAQFSPVLVQASGGMQRIGELLAEEPAVADRPGAGTLTRLSDRLALAGVGFAYPGRELALSGVDLEVPRGAFVAVVGTSGSGKSTVVKLLLRFHDPASGTVGFDGRDIRDVTQASLRSQLGVVFQENFLFNTSMRENIRIGRLDATDSEVETAARAAEIHDFIVSLPRGYDEPAGERGGRLSGGQRQRIAIARALLRDPAMLVLDEATSALDPPTEAAINATVARVAQGRGVLSVTHRLSAVSAADRIYVMDAGRVVESGRHADLLARNGFYARLWEKQTGLVETGPRGRPSVRPAALRRMRLLDHLDDELLQELAPRFAAESFARDQVIVREGDPGDKLYVIVRGRVEVTKLDAQRMEKRIAVLEDGDFFGEMALLEGGPRTASVRTASFCTCLTLPRALFVDLLDRFPDVRAEVEEAARKRRSEQEQFV
ncbi:MAG: ABC transporter transmembrane domain-containing protein [Gemmatimonadales bacterium]